MAGTFDPTDDDPPSDHRPGPRLDDHVFKLMGLAVVVLLGVGTVVYRVLEDWSWVDSFYFSTITLTTVGFGDLTPTRDASKLFTVAYVFMGIGLITAFITERLRRMPGRVQRRRGRAG
jgi:ABC-type branched-subunit amino acid transport system permease subunit